MKISRRRFLSSTALVTSGFLGLRSLLSTSGYAQTASARSFGRYGALAADPKRILDLPEGFSYHIVSRMGDFMDDGFRIPGAPDGMAAFSGPDGKTILVRNHENEYTWTYKGAFGLENELFSRIDRSKVYDAGNGISPHLGGTSTIVYDAKARKVERQFLSLAGTSRNCAGGPTPWNSWITCEETNETATDGNNEKDHGYNFEVPATAHPQLADPTPLIDMGRFRHEAIAVDPASGIIYQTEDRPDGLIYRYILNRPGKPALGGRLQALTIKDRKSVDTRNWPGTGEASFPMQKPVETAWIDIENVESPFDDLRYQGFVKGAARFARGEGMWYGRGEVYFACTNGGINQTGQIFRYRPSPHEGTSRESKHPGKLELYLEPNDNSLLENGDNITIAPWGDLIICEDGSNKQFLRGVTPEGEFYTLAENHYNESEFAGACFAPGGDTLFVNIQTPGITLAITGPWKS